MDRLEMLENRVLQLSLEMDVENNSRSSSSSFLGPEKRTSLVLQNHVQEFPRKREAQGMARNGMLMFAIPSNLGKTSFHLQVPHPAAFTKLFLSDFPQPFYV